MRPVFSLLLTLVPKPGESAAACFDKLARAAAVWAAGERLEPADGGPVVRRTVIDAARELLTVDGSWPDGAVRYAVAAGLARTPLQIQAHFVVLAPPVVYDGQPGDADPFRPGLVDQFLMIADGLVAGRPVPLAVDRLDKFAAGRFADDVLLDPGRQLPVVVLSPHPDTGAPLIDPERVLDELFGLAHVVELVNRDATFALTDRVGKLWSCFHGAARVYWPGVTLDDTYRRHPIFFASDYPPGPAADRLPLDLLRRVAGRTRFPDAPLVKELKAAADRQAQAAIQARIAELTAGAGRATELAAELDKAWADARRAADDRDLARLELDEARSQLAFEKEQWATAGEELGAAKAEADRHKAAAMRYRALALDGLRRVADAVDMARAEFTDTFMFLPSALKSAADSPYLYPRRVFDLFAALDEVMHAIRDAGRAGEDLHAAMLKRGFDYKPHVSATSVGKFGDEYTFVVDGVRRLFENHVTLGKGHNPQDCLSVHWVRDDGRRRFVVGWCGKHRTNTRT